MINQEQMDNNWNELMSIIDEHFEGEQKENILKLHSDFETEYKTAPASGRPNYHNCFKGGYLDHVLHWTNQYPIYVLCPLKILVYSLQDL